MTGVTNGGPTAIREYYTNLFAKHGDTPQGAGWPNAGDRSTRFDVMAALAGAHMTSARLCDLACGSGAFLDHLRASGRGPAEYLGVDLCALAIDCARRKFPQDRFLRRDVLAETGPALPEPVDYTVMNGLFTVKADLDEAEMWDFMTAMIARMWPVTRKGLAFNVMSTIVDWRRDDLNHVSMDRLAAWLFDLCGRRAVFRNDYDLYEYTVYLYRDPLDAR